VLRGVFTHLVSVKFHFRAADISQDLILREARARTGRRRCDRGVVFIGNESKVLRMRSMPVPRAIAAVKFHPTRHPQDTSRPLFHRRLLPLSTSARRPEVSRIPTPKTFRGKSHLRDGGRHEGFKQLGDSHPCIINFVSVSRSFNDECRHRYPLYQISMDVKEN